MFGISLRSRMFSVVALLTFVIIFCFHFSTTSYGTDGVRIAEKKEKVEREEGGRRPFVRKPFHVVLERTEEPPKYVSPGPPPEGIVPTQDWITIMEQGFEGPFSPIPPGPPPALWEIYGSPTWGKEDYRQNSGDYSAWCAAALPNGNPSGLDPQSDDYPNDMDAGIIFGPFDLSDATDARVLFHFWADTEYTYDYFYWLASVDNVNFYGGGGSGYTGGWLPWEFDLTDVYTLGNLCEEPEVWIAFWFTSDEIYSYEGTYIDDILVQKKNGNGQCTLTTAVEPSGCGTVSLNPPGGTYPCGTQVTLTAIPDPCCEFSHWSGDITGSANPTTITMDSSKNVTANFVRKTHTLNVTVNPPSSGNVTLNPPGGTYDCGTQVTLTATPTDPCYEFDHWSGSLSGSTNPTTITMNSNKSVTANFVKKTYTLTVSVTPSGSGSVNLSPPGGTYDCNTVVTLTAIPASQYWAFDYWSGDLSGSINPTTITMNGNKSVTAHFRDVSQKCTLTVTVNPSGSGSVTLNPPGGVYDCGTVVTLTATPADPCWRFDHWSGALSGSTNPTTITVNTNKSVTAHFVKITYTLTVSVTPSGSGSVTLNPPGGTYDCDTVITLTAVPADPCWRFDHWSGHLSGSANPAAITMNSHKNVTANFVKKTYTLTVSVTPSGSGSVNLSPPGGTYDCNTVVTLTAIPASQYWAFDYWSGDLSGSINPTTITMNGNKSVTANFEDVSQKCTLTVTVDPPSSGSVNLNPPGGVYDCGTQVTLTATPADPCWRFDHWSGALSGSTNPTTITVNTNKSVTAHFVKITYILTVSVTPPDCGIVTLNPPGGTYDCGTVVILSAIPTDPCCEFDHWSGSLSGSTNPTTITMDSNKSVTANFVKKTYTLAVAVDPPGVGSVNLNPPGGTYDCDTVVTLTATPIEHWKFDYWSGDLSGSSNPTTITMNGNKSVTANFEDVSQKCTLTVTVDPPGSGSVNLNPPGGTYDCGTVVALTAIPADECWKFDHWSGDLTGSSNPGIITVDSNKNVTAHFVKITYILTVSVSPAGSGSVTLNPPGGTYDCGTVVTLTATPTDPCYEFDHWSGDASGSASSTMVTMDSHKSVIAHFVEKRYTLTVTVDPLGSGSVTPNPPGGTYDCNTVVTLPATPTPDTDWKFKYWSGDLTGTTNPGTITMNGDKNVIAHFEIRKPDIAVNPPSWDYGDVEVNETVCKTFIVSNPGHAEMCVTDVNRIGNSDFSITSGDEQPESFCLNPGETQEIEVCFTPTSPEYKTAVLSITSNVVGKSPMNIPLKGTGIGGPQCPAAVISSDTVVHEELRQLRDDLLAKNETGQELARLYYQYSSEVVDILLEHPMLSLRSAGVLKNVMPGILFLVGDRKGKDIVMTPLLVARIKELFADIGKEGSEELAQTLSKLSDQLEEYEGMRFSQIWRTIDKGRPEEFVLLQNHPNPFNPDTWIPYQLKENADVVIRIYAATGQLVRTLNLGHKSAGFYTGRERAAYWDGKSETGEQAASGIYFYTMQARSSTATRKMVIAQ